MRAVTQFAVPWRFLQPTTIHCMGGILRRRLPGSTSVPVMRKVTFVAVCTGLMLAMIACSGRAGAPDEIFAANCCGNGGYLVFPRASAGNVPPLRYVSGPATKLWIPMDLAVDEVNREVVVAEYGTQLPGGSISTFPLSANGNVAPLRSISGPATNLYLPTGVAVDAKNDELVVAHKDGTVLTFARLANGSVFPIRTLRVSGLARKLTVDTVNDELIILTGASVVVYSRTASGDALPVRTFATGLWDPQAIAIDWVNDELIVVDSAQSGSIATFPRLANGNVAPKRVIAGSATGLSYPLLGVAIDTANNELMVAHAYRVSVFRRTAEGNVAPLRTLSGTATRLGTVTGVGVTVGQGSGSSTAVEVVEFYHQAFDHYFISHVAGEIAKLDAGIQIKGWTRTGYSFKTYTTAQAGTSPVCRYYIPPGLGDSHFFGRGSLECSETGQKNPSFELEDPAFMHMLLPAQGVCPANTTKVYRVFSNRPDANHRYMTDPVVRDQMVARGWWAEGDGPDRVVMCAPQ